MQITKEQYNKLPSHFQSYFTHGCSHPTVKPIRLFSYLITLGSRKGDIVLDPFLGSGTTALACQLLNRECFGIEINPDYCDIAEQRLSQLAKELL